MSSSRTRQLVVCAAALGGTAGLVAILVSRRKKQQLQREAELRSLEEERVKREVEAARDKAARHRARKQELDSPKSLTRRAERKRQEEERKRLEEEARIAEDKRRIEEEEKLIAEMKLKAEEEERRVAEARRRAEEEERHLAEAKLRAEEGEIRKAEEQKRRAEEKLRAEEEQRREAQAKLRAEEEKKREAEQKLRMHEAEKKRHEEEQRAREEAERAREEAEKRKQEEEQRAREEAERVKALEEEWKRKAEEHAAKHHEREEEVNRVHAQEEEVIGDAKAEPEVQQAAARSAEAEAEMIAEEEEWQKAENEMIRVDHSAMVGMQIRINTTGEIAKVEEAANQCQFCKVVFAEDLADATPGTTVWARLDAVEAVPMVGDEVTVKMPAAHYSDSPGIQSKGGEVILKTVKRVGELSQVNNTDFPYQVKFSDGHCDLFKARDVEIHRRHGQSTRFRSVRGRISEFDESGTSCLVHFVEGTLAGETAWLDEDALETIPIIGCSMRVKSRNCRGELIKYDDSARAADWPYMIQLEDGGKDWYRNTDAEVVFEVGCWVRIATPGLFIGEITEPPHEHPYQIRFCRGDKEGVLDWSRRCNFVPSAEVDSPVMHRKTGRSGTVVLKDDSDMPCKVLFNDGSMPLSDWYKESDLEVVATRPSAKTM